MSRTFARQLLVAVILLMVVSCAGGGSGGCSGCGMKPIPGGFPKKDLIENAASVRVTRPGLDFLGGALPGLAGNLIGGGTSGGVIEFEVPKSTGTLSICPNGPNKTSDPPLCVAEIGIGNAKLHLDSIIASDPSGVDKKAQQGLLITGTIPIRIRDLPINIPVLGDLALGVGTGKCSDGKPNFTWKDFPISVKLPLVKETISPRDGYLKADLPNATIDLTIVRDDLQICKDCGILDFACKPAISGFVDLAFPFLKDTLTSQVTGALGGILCTKPDAAGQCPDGAKLSDPDPTKATCVYVSQPAVCMPMALGLDGHMDVGSLLSGFAPGAKSEIDFNLAAGGNAIPAPSKKADDIGYPGHTPNGLTIGMLGGANPMPISQCVPGGFVNDMPTGIPIPDELLADKPVDWVGAANDPGPDVSIALAGRFLNHALGSLYQSGTLCLGITTDTVQQLNSGLVSALIPSLKNLAFEQKPASLAITTRPGTAPILKLGGGTDIAKDPLLQITLNKFSVDFYVWTYDRYARAFTFTADIIVPVNLQTAKDPVKNPNGGLLPVLGDLVLNNPVITNNEPLTENPTIIAQGLAGVVSGLSGQLVGSLSAIDLSGALSSLGLKLTIPEKGIRKLSKGTDDFLAIFAKLGKPTTSAVAEVQTDARLVRKAVNAAGLSLATARPELLPTLDLVFDAKNAAAGESVEYSWAIDEGTRSAWSPSREVAVHNAYLFFQGKHTLKVWGRIVGAPDTEDATPALVPFTIDVLAPVVQMPAANDGVVHVSAFDYVTADAALVGRFRTTGLDGVVGEWSAWTDMAKLATIDVAAASAIDVDVKDEEENVGHVSQALIRGRTDTTLGGASGCGCATPGSAVANGPNGVLCAIAILAGMIAVGARRRQRVGTDVHAAARIVGGRGAVVALGSIIAVLATAQGCSCGDEASAAPKTGCGGDCNTACEPAIPQGLIGVYTSVAKAKDGTLWVAGYNDLGLPAGASYSYGDLVVGTYDSGKKAVGWRTVDGLPAPRTDGTCPEFDPKGWRGGEIDSGDDVGLWTSMRLDAQDHPMVSYYDATNSALKFARFDGTSWTSHTVSSKSGADIGRYGKMTLDAGKPVIAFLTIEPGNAGKVRSKVTLARAKNAAPAAGGDWSFEDAGVDEDGPCRASMCKAGDTCVKETKACQTPVTGCTPSDCSGGVCVTIDGGAACGSAVAKTTIDSFPNAFGTYISLADGPKGMGLAVYDRIRGNLVGLQRDGDKWSATILDGETGSRANGTAVDTGDVGVGASLAITDNGNWHVSYVNGLSEALQYVMVVDGAPQKPEIVDDGSSIDGQLFADGKHVVGDDSLIQVDASGTVRILYQDSTSGTLRLAAGQLQSDKTHRWSVKVVPQPGLFAGFFPRPIPGTDQVSNFWRRVDPSTKDINGDVALVTP